MSRAFFNSFVGVKRWLNLGSSNRGGERYPLSPFAKLQQRLAVEELEARVTPALLAATSFFDSAVYEFDANTGALAATFVAPYTSSLLSGPAGLTVGSDGNLYISSQFNNSILEYNCGANTLSTFISSSVLGPIATSIGAPSFAPAALRFGPDGNLYVDLNGGQSSTTGAVVRFDINAGSTGLAFDGAHSVVATTGLVQPGGLTFGPAGDATSLYVSSAGTDTVVKIANATGTSPTASTFITGGADTGNLSFPSGLTWGPDGKLYAVDLGAVSYQGNVLRFNAAGSFDEVYAHANSSGAGGLLYQFPSDPVFDAQGRLDTANLGAAYPPNLGGSINRYDSSGVFDTTLVSSAQFPDAGTGTSGIAPSQLALLPAATITNLVDNGPNPSAPGQAVSFTVTIVGASSTNGDTVWIEDADASNAIVASPTLDSAGAVTFTISDLSLGTHHLFAVFNGDAANAGSNSSATPVAHFVNTADVAPAVASVVINGGTPAYTDSNGLSVSLAGQNSVVEQILVTFNEAVTLDAGAFTITNNAAAVTVNAGSNPNALAVNANFSVLPGSGNTQWIVTFTGPGTTAISGGTGNVIKDGVYILNTIGSKVHANGQTAADNSTGFWALYGSAANDNTPSSSIGDGASEVFVDNFDYSLFKAVFGSESNSQSGPPAYNVALDGDLDGLVDNLDYSAFKANFGTDWMF